MAYGLRIRLEFRDDQDAYYAVNLSQRDYSGAADVRELTGTPAIIEYGDSSADEFPIVLGAMASINFYAEDGDNWGVLYTADRRKFRLDIRKDNAATGPVIFTGWLMPQEYSERLTWQPTLSIKAICGLGELKELDYTDPEGNLFTGRQNYLQILTGLLARLDLNLPIHTAIDWRDSLMAAGDAFAQSFVDVSIYAGLNCREVLDQILTGCRIMQRSGAWYIESYTALKRATHTRYNYDTAGAVLSAPNTISLKGEIDQEEIWTEGTPTLQRWPAYDKLVLEQNYGKKPSFLTNYNLDGLSGWTVPTGVVIYDHSAEDKTYKCISGIDANGVTAGIYQVVPIKKFATDTKIKFSVQVAPVGWHRSTSTVARGIPLTPLAVAIRVQVVLLNSSQVAIAWLSKDGWVETAAFIDEADVQSTISGTLSFHNIEIETGYPTDLGVGEDFFIKVLLAKAPYQSFGVPGSNWGVYVGLVYGEVIITEGGDFKTGQTLTGLNTDRYLDKKDDLKLLAGTVPVNINSPLIWAGGLSYTVSGNDRADKWKMDGSSLEYGFCELVARMLLSLRRRPVPVMQANAVGASIEAVYNELNQPGVDYVFVGGSVDLQTRKIDGNWAELLDYTPDAGVVNSGERVTSGNGDTFRSSGNNETRVFGGGQGTPKRINDLTHVAAVLDDHRFEVDKTASAESQYIEALELASYVATKYKLAYNAQLNRIEVGVDFSTPGIISALDGNSTNWNAAFGWGNHAGLYRPLSYVPSWGEITGKPTWTDKMGWDGAAVTIAGDMRITGKLVVDGTIQFFGTGAGGGGGGGSTTLWGLSDVSDDVANAVNGDLIMYNGTHFARINQSVMAPAVHSHTIGQVNGLQGALDTKMVIHTHPYLSDSDARITNWNTAYTHSQSTHYTGADVGNWAKVPMVPVWNQNTTGTAATATIATNWSGSGALGNYLLKTGGIVSGNVEFTQASKLLFANGQYLKDNGGGGLEIYSAVAINLNASVSTNELINSAYRSLTPFYFTLPGFTGWQTINSGSINANGIVNIGTANNATVPLYVALDGGVQQLRLGHSNGANYWELGRDNLATGDLLISDNAGLRLRVSTLGATFSAIVTATGGFTGKLNGQVHTTGTDGWWRSDGAAGWYSETYAVGIYATEAGMVRTFNNASFHAEGGLSTGGNITANGNIIANGTIQFYTASDRRLKTDFETIINPIEKIKSLTGYFFNYTDQAMQLGGYTNRRDIGLIAQDVHAILPEATGKLWNTDFMGYKADKLAPLFVEGFKQQDTRMMQYDIEIRQLKQEINNLKQQRA